MQKRLCMKLCLNPGPVGSTLKPCLLLNGICRLAMHCMFLRSMFDCPSQNATATAKFLETQFAIYACQLGGLSNIWNVKD